MKLTRHSWRDAPEFSVEEAVKSQVDARGDLYDGQIETLQERVEELTNIVARLLDLLSRSSHPSPSEIAAVIGYSWDVKQ
jgi:hypothetical protein